MFMSHILLHWVFVVGFIIGGLGEIFERDEEVRYINGSGCLLIEICINVCFSFPNSGINIKEY